MPIVRYLSWLLRAFVFVAIFVLALKNTEPVTLHSYFEQSWRLPLVLLLLVFFIAGAALGGVACLAKIFVQRRELQRLKRQLGAVALASARQQPPFTVP
jgi:putative membrane protein